MPNLIGFWCDRSEPYWPDPVDFVDATWAEPERALVVARLTEGHEVRQFRGDSTCRFCGRQNGSRELSDGTYVWPEGLAHYLRDHAVRLPEPIEAHFVNGEPARVTGNNLRGIEADETWWLSLGSADWL